MKKVLITGGSSGIGLEMSRHWAKHGYSLLWVSHDANELTHAKLKLEKEIPGVEIQTFAQDLTEKSGPLNVFRWATEEGPIDTLINNAGFGTYGLLETIDVEKELSMIQLNAICLYKLTRYFLDEFLKKDTGTIINICSNSAFQPIPRMTTYAATKGFVYQFSRGLQLELEIRKSKVRVMTICPAAISDTPFRKHLPGNVKTFQGLATTTAKEVARDVWKGYTSGKNFVVSGRKMRMLYFIRGLIPPPLTRYLVKKETENIE